MKYLFILFFSLFLLQACSDGVTSVKDCNSETDCDAWESCNSNNKCDFRDGMCNEDKDCTDTVKTVCTEEHLCVEPVEVATCTDGGNECSANTNGKTVCIDGNCLEPIEVEDCSVDGGECLGNTNGKTTCGDDLKCQLPPDVENCTLNGDECANNTNGLVVCVDSKCSLPVEVVDCTANGNECVDNTNGAVECDINTNKCLVPNCEVKLEVCDGIDNDCDGFIDEDLIAPSADKISGVCDGSKKSCDGVNGWIEPDYSLIVDYEEGLETKCDDLDNNCDNSIDEGCSGCTDGDKKSCGLDVGACESGQQVCENGVWGVCEGGVTPVDEICDGRDNDCDGDIDNDLSAPISEKQEGVCEGIKQDCDGINGWIEPDYTSVSGYEVVELECDDLDNNCDGNVDEGVKLTYYRDADNDGYGDASDFKTSCTPPEGYVLNKDDCYGDNNPNIYKGAEEVCDGLDNDCDGQVDEDYPNTDGDLLPDCLDSDDDNDGDPDELDCAPLDASINHSAGELCDLVDNNCDNSIDEGCSCVVDETQVCGSNIGECSEGLQVCDVNGAWGSCQDSITPAIEICDGLDNNCDGTIDEGCGCIQGDTQPCGSDVGECVKGTQTCIAGVWGACENQVLPTTELCDGLDNNCNGEVDDNLVVPNSDMQLGVCAGSKKVCNGVDGWGEPDYTLISTYELVEASCDNLDNDCDNQIDETPIELCTTDASVSVQACVRTPNGNMCKPIVNDVKDTDSGHKHSCSLNTSKDTISCWGTNTYGQLGVGDNNSYYSAQTVIGINTNVKEVVSGANFSCALMNDTTIKCWGDNNSGQLGDSSNNDSNSPVYVNFSWNYGGGIADTFIDIDAGSNHACGVTDNGNVYCWGANNRGQLGNDSSNDRNSAVRVEDKNGDPITNIIKVSAGELHTCALSANGNVYCWGDNNFGQLGIGNNNIGDREKQARLVINLNNAVDLVLGANFSCVIDDLSDVRCWGDNSNNQIRYNNTSFYALPTSLSINNASKLKAGYSHLCIETSSSVVECRGHNLYSQVGSSDSVFDLSGTTSGYPIVNMGLGFYHSCVVVDSNYKALMCKGSNFYGQLGLEYTSSSISDFHFVIDNR